MTDQKPMRLRRCQLSVPGSNEKMMAKAAGLPVDHVFLDLEDAVAPSAKVDARSKIVKALREHDWGKKTRCVRINDLRTQWAYEDIIHIVEEAADYLDTIMIPKALSATDVLWVDILLGQMEKKMALKKRIGLEVLIEEVEAIMNVEEIAASTPRLEAIIFGMGDYSASQRVDRKLLNAGEYPGDVWHYQRHKVVVAARVAGIDPVDGPFGNFADQDGFRREATRARVLGCVGKWAIHPSQIAPATEIFTPDKADVEAARKLKAAYEAAEAEGLGSINVDGQMVDAASIRIQENILRQADLMGI